MKNMRFLSWILIFTFLVGFYSCKENNEIVPDLSNGGIVINFDDSHVSQWAWADSQLKDYKWKATFCISDFGSLTEEEIQQLHVLNNNGHEIAGHGLHHLSALDYFSTGRSSEYLNEEIIPMVDLMENEGFSVKSFSYPFGLRNEETDSCLLNYFDILRGVGWGGNMEISAHNCFFENSPIVHALGIDTHYPYFQGQNYDQYILDLLTYARDNNKIIIVYGHKVVENVTEDYEICISTLASICSFIEENDMDFYTLSELKKMVK